MKIAKSFWTKVKKALAIASALALVFNMVPSAVYISAIDSTDEETEIESVEEDASSEEEDEGEDEEVDEKEEVEEEDVPKQEPEQENDATEPEQDDSDVDLQVEDAGLIDEEDVIEIEKDQSDVKEESTQEDEGKQDEAKDPEKDRDERTWKENEDGSMTIEVLEGEEYEFEDSGLKLNFSKMEEESGQITVKKIKLSAKQVEELNALSETAWDITSNMENGTFEYELTLPISKDLPTEDLEVLYVEDEDELDDPDKAKNVDRADLELNLEKEELVAKDLDHFTTFVIATFSDATFTTSKSQYLQGETVYLKSEGMFVSRWYRIDVSEPDGTEHNVFSCKKNNTEVEATFNLASDSQISPSWNANIEKYNLKGDCEARQELKDKTSVGFEVLENVSAWPPMPTLQQCRDDFGGRMTICHSTSSETNPYNKLSLPCNAIFGAQGNAGHFFENGTTKAGHEDDVVTAENGLCPGEEPGPWCGDGEQNQQEEQCDDGNNESGDGCSEACEIEQSEPVCGDGVLNEDIGEQCDFGDLNGESSCSSSCQFVGGCGDQMVANGSFEMPVVENSFDWDIFSSSRVPGWTARWYDGGGERPEPQIELHSGVLGASSDGNQHVELDSDWDGPGGSINGEEASTSISQQIPTIPGYQYKLTWKYSPRPNHSDNRLQVSVEDEDIFDSGDMVGGSDVDWHDGEFEFAARYSLTEILFLEVGNPDSLGMFLDEVKMECFGPEFPTLEIADPSCEDGKKYAKISTDYSEDIFFGNAIAPKNDWFEIPSGAATSDQTEGVVLTYLGNELMIDLLKKQSNERQAFVGSIEFFGAEITTLYSGAGEYKLEDENNCGSSCHMDVFEKETETKLDFDLVIDVAHDRGIVELEQVEVPCQSQCQEGETWANSVVTSVQGTLKNGNPITNPERIDAENALGQPDGQFFSIGYGGSIVIGFEFPVMNVSGDDLSFHEVTWGRDSYPVEKANVQVSPDGNVWKDAGMVTNKDGSDGVGYVDFSSTGWSWIKYVRVTDVTDDPAQNAVADGYDLDAVDATHGTCQSQEHFCGDGIKMAAEACDGSDGVTPGENFCTTSCTLAPIYNGQYSCPDGLVRSSSPVTSFDISSTDADGQSFNLSAGGKYLFEASGTFSSSLSGHISDAGYTTTNDWNSLESQFGIAGSGNDFAAHALLADLGGGVGVVDWGGFEQNHIYSKYFEPTSNSVQFVIGDRFGNWFDTPIQNQGGMGDNSGSLQLDVYECQAATGVKICKMDENENKLAGWDLQLLGDYVESAIVPTGSSAIVSSSDLSLDNYVLKAGGTYQYRGNSGLLTDANFSERKEQDGYSGSYFPWINVNDLGTPGALGIMVDGSATNWSNYLASDHVYALGRENHSGTIDFSIFDDYYADNVGNLVVDIYEGYAGTTGEDGCVTFGDVPFGVYEIAETFREGWENIDGPGDVVVADWSNEFFVRNREIPAPINVVAHKIVCELETDLPNWGLGENVDPIDWQTAENWVTNHDSCRFEQGWNFQWSLDGVGNPGDNIYDGGTGWNTFGPTDSNGRTATQVDISDDPGRLWFREMFEEDHIPFAYDLNGGNNENNFSAEFYCHDDILNYDNWEWLYDLEAGKTYFCVAFNSSQRQSEAELFINKTNNEWEDGPEVPGDEVVYTIQVRAEGDGVEQVVVTDLPPKRFTYVAGSWTADSSVRGDLKALGITTEPTYASPGDWELGNLVGEEIVTLSYRARIGAEVDPGVYPDLAFAKGVGGQQELIALSEASSFDVDQGIVDENFVGTQIAITEFDLTDSVAVKIEEDEKTEEKEEVRVLGAATFLPATGASGVLVVLALVVLLLGISGMFWGVRLKNNNNGKFPVLMMGFVLSGGLFFAQGTMAGSLSVRVEEPKTPTNESFELSFVAADVLERSVDVECFKKGPGEGSFSQFDSIGLVAGGTSAACQVGKAVLTQNGNYEFRVVAGAGVDEKTSDTVAVQFDGSSPRKPRYIEKDKKGYCKNEIEFKTADDGQTSYVEVYQSHDDKTFSANNSTRISTINIGPDKKHTFTVDLDSDKCVDEYYYAVRAFNQNDNPSDVRVEEVEKIVEETVYVDVDAEPVPAPAIAAVEQSDQLVEVEGEAIAETGAEAIEVEAEEVIIGEEGAQEGAEVRGVATEGKESLSAKASLLAKNKYLWLGLLIIAAAGYFLFAKKKKAQQTK